MHNFHKIKPTVVPWLHDVRGQVFMFVDDTKIFRCTTNSMDSSKLQKDLDTIMDWADKWQMNFNVSKCKVM